jgi:hypothetical protein
VSWTSCALAAHLRAFNYPLPVTPANAQCLYREGERMIVWLGVAATVVGITRCLRVG